ncbi:TonB-dependent receptor [Litorivivens sp.]|uniref:TonB-dependent receptor n=1 Tax=Litorivivens sp. TaxID=2020868 RepID=UPI00356A59C7
MNRIASAGLAATITLVCQLVNAQQTDNSQQTASSKRNFSGALEEVVVTARKRAESIQETPVAVTAISGDDLRAQGIVNTTELTKSVPSLQINDSTSTQIFIRGIGQRAGLIRQDPSVSVYLDGIFIPRADGQLLDTIDIDSVQVLRGPQGTLFGKNNTGGALVFTLTKPSEEQQGYVEVALGNYNDQRIRAAYDFPVNDDFYTRIAFNSHRRDGFIKDLSTSNNQSVDRLSAIFQTRWLISDELTFDTFTFLGKIDERYPSYHCKLVNENALFVNGLGILWPGDTDPANPRAYKDNCAANDRDTLPDLTTNMGASQRQTKKLDTLMFGATFDWALSDTHDLKAIVGYRDALKTGPQTNSDDAGPEEYQKAVILGEGDQDSLTLELQLNGSVMESRVDYTAGVFWQHEYKSETFLTSDPIIGVDAVVLAGLLGGQYAGTPPSLLPQIIGTPLPIVAALLPLDTRQNFEIEGQTSAVFSQATWHITENLELTVGGRYTEEQRESKLVTQIADNAAVSAIVGADPRFNTLYPDLAIHTFNGAWLQDPIRIANQILKNAVGHPDISSPLSAPKYDKRDSTFSQFTPMASASWFVPSEWLDDNALNSLLMYGTWSNGFKSGFLEPSGQDGLVVVDPEKLENREIGVKIDAFERSVRLNIALYSMIFEDMQLITVKTDSANTLVVTSQNAGESVIEGGELELMWIPTAQMMVTLSYSNNNYKFKEFVDQDLTALATQGRSVEIDRSDEQFPVSPEQTASLGMQYTFVTPVGLITPRIDFSYKSEIYLGFDNGSWDVRHTNPEGVYSDAYTLVDARVTWNNNEDDLSISAYVKNATDERYDIGAVATGDSIGTFAQALGNPRFYGVELRKTF